MKISHPSATEPNIDEISNGNNFWLSARGFITLSSIIVVIWAAYAVIIILNIDVPADRGVSGDLFGGITALFSGWAFSGLIFTLLVQKEELKLQRLELSQLVKEQKNTTTHLKGQEDQLRVQSKYIEKQVFEASYFSLVSTLNAQISNIEYKLGGTTFHGKEALERLKNFYFQYGNESAFGGDDPSDGSISFEDEYLRFYDDHKDDLGPYFRQIYNILKYIDLSHVDNKNFYSNILRAQLNDSELFLLALNGASRYGIKKMSPLMRKYNILKHLTSTEDLFHKFYDDTLRVHYEEWDFVIRSQRHLIQK